MTSIRLKLMFERLSVNTAQQCWMLVDLNTCKYVRDLEYVIVKKFFDCKDTVVNLYLEDFLLPSLEKINVIRENDVIRVVEENIRLSPKKEKKKSCLKRKNDKDSNNQAKKAKKSSVGSENGVNNAQQHSNVAKNLLTNEICNKKSKNVDNSTKDSAKGSVVVKQNKEKAKKRKKKVGNKTIAEKINGFWSNLVSIGNHQNSNSTENIGEDLPIIKPTEKKEKSRNDNILSSKENSKRKNHCNDVNSSSSKTNQGNHIRFNDDENDEEAISSVDETSVNNPILPLIHPRVLSIRGDEIPTSKKSLDISPITDKHASTAADFNTVCERNAHRKKESKRKDSYTNKSIVLESTRVEKDLEVERIPLQSTTTAENREKDFTIHPLLQGPPRVGDFVAYKMIELSQSYTPEVSKYKQGKVLSYDSMTNQLKLKLTKDSLEKPRGDGHISYKFEIFENDEEEVSDKEKQDVNDEVEIQWTSMIDPRLISNT
ncbi:coilin-like [Xenia sp. Carnegie-2017]|uniref:coilin-like n=1 Tax=Xenia sp. Carnegie-2017 TaxID=2897299 RepID=UPI001F04FCAA|nr:coilin-like [Xenia sp. Carnegie-2017]